MSLFKRKTKEVPIVCSYCNISKQRNVKTWSLHQGGVAICFPCIFRMADKVFGKSAGNKREE